jgi:tRNA1Val (adenine37-N6)-methyltransferase
MSEPSEQDIQAARDAFPTGLDQPEGGYRFSLDPLLLAVFARPKKNARLADLGTGCGVAALAALLAHPQASSALGLDLDPAMTLAADANAARLGLSDRFAARTLDIRALRHAGPGLEPESFGLVLANPPYRRPGTGQPCPGTERNRARFETGASLEDFLNAAARLLANRGALAIVFPAARLPELMSGCLAAKLAPKRLRLVHSRLHEPARLALLEAVKNAGDELTVEPPLILYEGQGEATRMTEAALAYCPFLAKNP